MVDQKICRRCKQHFPLTAFYKTAANADGHEGLCKLCSNAEHALRRRGKRRKDYHSDASRLVSEAKRRARARGLPCTIRPSDIVIPAVCPCLGIPLQRGKGIVAACSPTLDRIRPDCGYVPGNVWVISHKANMIKSNATAAELESVAQALRRLG